MPEAVEKRFGAIRAPPRIEWLSDKGSPHTAAGTGEVARPLNLAPCFTPVASPKSNRMSAAFVTILKRDDLRVRPVPDAVTAPDQIAGWFEDDNDNHPHSGPKIRSPRDVIKAQQLAEMSG